MTASSLATSTSAASTLDRVRELQSRIREMQSTTLESKALATSPTFAGVLPDGMLRAGAAYSIHGSLSLVMGLLAAPSGAGAWCGVIGVPEFGAQAAAAHGIDLSRLVLVPEPGEQWLTVTAAIVDVLTVVVIRPTRRLSDADANRVAARLRKRDAALISLGDWPGSEARLTVRANEWSGLGDGHGMITGRRIEVQTESRGRPPRRRWVSVPLAGRPVSVAPSDATLDIPVTDDPSSSILRAV